MAESPIVLLGNYCQEAIEALKALLEQSEARYMYLVGRKGLALVHTAPVELLTQALVE